MTTVAWDGTTLAGDRQASYGNTPVQCTKVIKTDTGLLVGASGDLDNTLRFYQWVRDGRPNTKPELYDAFSGVVIELDNSITYYSHRLIPNNIALSCWALGSGADYALGAMAAGAKAKKAVKIACDLDVNSGLGIDEVRR